MKNQKFHFWLFLVAFYAIWILRATWLYSRVDMAIPNETWRLVFSNGMKFLLWAAPAAAYIVWHDLQNPLATMKVSTRLDRRGVIIGTAVSLVYLAGIIAVEYLSFHQTLEPLFQASPRTILAALASLFFSPIIEELFFRGFVLPKLNERLPFWPANLLQAILFVAIHWPSWLWLGGFHWDFLITSVSILLLALLLGWLTRRTNSIWPAVVMHIANNFLAAFME